MNRRSSEIPTLRSTYFHMASATLARIIHEGPVNNPGLLESMANFLREGRIHEAGQSRRCGEIPHRGPIRPGEISIRVSIKPALFARCARE
jgi:hypothetical protein